MKVFLTGASGFVGSHVARALLSAGHTVAVLVRPDNPLRRLRDVVDQLGIWHGDLANPVALRQTLADWRPDACIHLAWYAEPEKYLHSPENISSLTCSVNLLQVLADTRCRQFIGAGTCAEYDTNRGFLREDAPTRPATLYAAAKLSLCLVGQQLAALAGIRFAWGRIFYPYGPAENSHRLVPAAIHAILDRQLFPATLGDQVRDYVHVEDVAAAFLTLLEKQAEGVFNIASGQPVTVRRLLEIIEKILGSSGLVQFGALPYRAWEPPFVCGDISKLRWLGWIPRYDLGDGLRQTVEWWQRHSSGKSYHEGKGYDADCPSNGKGESIDRQGSP